MDTKKNLQCKQPGVVHPEETTGWSDDSNPVTYKKIEGMDCEIKSMPVETVKMD